LTSIMELLGGELKIEGDEQGDEQSSGSERLRLSAMAAGLRFSGIGDVVCLSG
jgi:hypothetical protein